MSLASQDGVGHSITSRAEGLVAKSESAFGETVFTVSPADYRALCERLYAAGFDYPRCLSGADMEYGLRVTLHLTRLASGDKAVVRTDVTYEHPRLPSVSDLWGGVEWHEREAYDLVGISFDGHPDHRRILLEDDWTIHPLQRRFNSKGYLMPDWAPKPFPQPAPWENPPPAVEAAPAAAAPVAAPAAAAATGHAAPETAAPAAAVPAEGGERARKPPKRWEPKPKAEGETPVATAQTVDPGTPSPAVGEVRGSTGQTGAPPVDPDRAERRDTAVSQQSGQEGTTLPSADPAQIGERAAPIPDVTTDYSAGRGVQAGAEAPLTTSEPITAQSGVTPLDEPKPAAAEADGERPRKQFKRWEPKKAAGETPSGDAAKTEEEKQ
jgi:NADH-quinone oxidoreductase subunit C